jgi:Fe-S-cluster containining protein
MWQQSVFRDDRSRRVLKQRDGGDCTFLGEQGCTLPADVRPLVCRLYPYDYDARGIRPHFAGGCPTQLLMPGETLGTAIGMTRADAELWHRQLYAEIVTEQHLVAQA